MIQGCSVWQHNKAAVRLSDEFTNSTLDAGSIANCCDCWHDRETWCRGFDQARVVRAAAGGEPRIEYKCDALDARSDLFEQLQPFAGQRGLDVGEPGRVTSRACQAFDEVFPDRVGDYRENDRDCTRLLEECRRHRRAPG